MTSIKDTKEQIAVMSNPTASSGEHYIAGPNHCQRINYGQAFLTTEFSAASLQALSNNHTRLLTAAKKYLSLGESGNGEDAETVEKELREAIEEAEK